MCTLLIRVLCLLLLSSLGRCATDDEIRQLIDNFVEEVRQCQQIPGFTLAAVKDDQVFHAQGYGVKDIATSEPVTNETLFVIASTTKAFAATLIADVIRDHGYDWNTPVKDIFGSWFHLSDPYRRDKITLRDLLAHRTNFPGHDATRVYGFSRRELLTRMRFLNFAGEFRDTYRYNNLMYGLATHVPEVLENRTWEDLAAERIFRPLGMDRTTFIQLARDRYGEFAKSYFPSVDSPPLREVSLDATAAMYSSISSPGAVSSNAVDMAKWMMMLMNDGRAQDGTQVIHPADIRATWDAVMATPRSSGVVLPDNPIADFVDAYGLGWSRGIYRGYARIRHQGAMTGFRSQVDLLPDMKIGVFVASNSPGVSIRHNTVAYVYDLLLGYTPLFNASDICSLLLKEDDALNAKEPKAAKLPLNLPPRNLSQYAGRYGNMAYGNVTFEVNETSNQLLMHYGPYTWGLSDSGDDTLSGFGFEPFWYWPITVDFSSDVPATNCSISFEGAPHTPVFIRDLDVDTFPDPPELCP